MNDRSFTRMAGTVGLKRSFGNEANIGIDPVSPSETKQLSPVLQRWVGCVLRIGVP